MSQSERLIQFLDKFSPEKEPVERGLALFSASIAIANENALISAIKKAAKLGASVKQIYEIVLQSYLFLGFPRMLTAVESFRTVFPIYNVEAENDEDPLRVWTERGTELCKRVYSGNYEKLKNKVISFTPEIFDWIILEGYGKVLSRNALDIRIRELAIISCLMIENRPKQLHSHIQGALNVGVSEGLLRIVINDIGQIDEDGYKTALELLSKTNAAV